MHRAGVWIVWTMGAVIALAACKRKPGPGQIDCDTEIEYQGRTVEGRVDAGKFGAAEAKTSLDAVRQIDQVVERYLARWRGMCREYNAGVYDKESYRVESRAMRQKMEELDALLMKLANAPDSAAYQAVLTSMYRAMVPAEERETLELSFRVLAQRPGDAAPALVREGERLPTGTKLSFELSPSRSAYVYLYQVSPSGEVSVLFPDPRIAARNPLSGALQLPPPPGSFRLNAEDVGRETVHLVASRTALPELESTLGSPGVSAAAAGCSSRGLEYDAGAPSGCEGTRGLEYDAGGEGASLAATSELGGDRIVQAFSFEHVP
ncbi:MAG: DUF4384 domain-containing protein [Nannocystaceae bacterium]